MLREKLNAQLRLREKDGTLRSLGHFSSGLADFSSNDYLGLARLSLLEESDSTGATGSRLLTGNSELAEETEKYLALLWGYPSFLFFPSGYMANMGVLSCLSQRDNIILMDRLSHACIKDGARLSHAEYYSFAHNDLEDLEKKLNKNRDSAIVVVESVYSMDGDEAPLLQILDLTEKYGAELIVDEAHATGIAGKNGGGLSEELSIQDRLLATIYTFGKGFGYHGAGVGASQPVIEYLINYSRPFIYTTAMPDSFYRHLKKTADQIIASTELRNRLQENIDLFHSQCRQFGIGSPTLLSGNRAIQGILVPGNNNCKKVSQALQQKGFDVRPILSPTIKSGSERLRICVHSFNTPEEIKELVNELSRQL